MRNKMLPIAIACALTTNAQVDLEGRRLLLGERHGGPITLPVAELAPGTYLVRTYAGELPLHVLTVVKE